MNVTKVKSMISGLIDDMEKTKQNFVVNPQKDFTRTRMISFSDTIRCLLNMESGTLNTELRCFFSTHNSEIPTSSAFIQQRTKLRNNTFSHIFQSLNLSFPFPKLQKGYHLLAVDGSDTNIPSLKNSPETTVRSNTKGVDYHQFHLNAMFDLLEHRYVDYVIQPRATADERAAFCEMVRKNTINGKCIYICDRGYSSLNTIYTVISAGQFFLFRLQDLKGKNSLFKYTETPCNQSFDIDIEFHVTRCNKKEYRNDKAKYKIVRTERIFDGIPSGDRKSIIVLNFRLLKFMLDNGSYEYIATNLPKSEFDIYAIRELYNKRWGIETSFRILKYNLSLSFFHSKKRVFIIQELEARLIAFNITMLLVSCAHVKKHGHKYKYKVAISDAVVTMRLFLAGKLSAKKVINDLLRYLTPIRPGRSFQRKVRSKRVIPFNYRG